MQMSYSDNSNMMHSRHMYDQPPYSMSGPSGFSQNPQMMQGRLPPGGHPAPPQGNMPQQMDGRDN